MFVPQQLVIKMIDEDTRFVRRVISVDDTHYTVSDPMFCCFGCIFARWSVPKRVTKTYMEKNFTPLNDQLSTLYNKISKGNSTSTLFI